MCLKKRDLHFMLLSIVSCSTASRKHISAVQLCTFHLSNVQLYPHSTQDDITTHAFISCHDLSSFFSAQTPEPVVADLGQIWNSLSRLLFIPVLRRFSFPTTVAPQYNRWFPSSPKSCPYYQPLIPLIPNSSCPHYQPLIPLIPNSNCTSHNSQ